MAGKRYKAAAATVDVTNNLSVADAVKSVKANATAKFDETIEIAMNLALVGRVARILGPKGMMPNPKVGTVTMDVTKAVSDAKGGAVEFRVEKAGVIHAGVGKASFAEDKLAENVTAFLAAIQKARPSGAKGVFVKKIALTSTMGPSVRIDTSEVPS